MTDFFKKNYINILLILIFIVGLGVLLYPNISDYFNQKNSSRAVAEYDDTINKMNEAVRSEVYDSSVSYNIKLTQNAARFADMSAEEYDEYMAQLNIDGEGMMGYLKVDKLGINVPIYHSTKEEILQKYIGHVEGTSLPVGGVGTHCALSGHRGLPSAVLFTNLDRMEIGDEFSIFVLGQELVYVVDQIETVLPDDVSPLAIDPEKDLCTLITCTPYGVNTHRLMVRGVRVHEVDEKLKEGVIIDEYGNEVVVESTTTETYGLTREEVVNYIAIGMVGLFGIVILLIIILGKNEELPTIILRPWDDSLADMFDAADFISAYATRENWAVGGIVRESDKMKRYRGFENRQDFFEEDTWDDDIEARDDLRDWDDDILDKVDDDWSNINPNKYMKAYRFK